MKDETTTDLDNMSTTLHETLLVIVSLLLDDARRNALDGLENLLMQYRAEIEKCIEDDSYVPVKQ